MTDMKTRALALHKENQGKLAVHATTPVTNKEELSLAYSPGVAAPCLEIADDISKVYDYTWKGRTVAVISDGSAVLGLGDIGSEASLPVMEGKCVLFKEFAGIDAVPVVLNTQNVDEIISIVRAIAPTYGGINLEDISAPRCFEIEERLQDLGIPVFHDDQHGTAVVVLAGLINATKVVGKSMSDMRIVMSGAGAAGIAIAKLLSPRVADIVMCDSCGVIHNGREDLNETKKRALGITNKDSQAGGLMDVIKGADVFIGVSAPGILSKDMVRSMASDAIVFALANPDPEIMPKDALAAGAAVVATGRSDYPNQVNNVLGFPGIFKGALEARLPAITEGMKIRAAEALAALIDEPRADYVIPDPFDDRVVGVVADAVKDF